MRLTFDELKKQLKDHRVDAKELKGHDENLVCRYAFIDDMGIVTCNTRSYLPIELTTLARQLAPDLSEKQLAIILSGMMASAARDVETEHILEQAAEQAEEQKSPEILMRVGAALASKRIQFMEYTEDQRLTDLISQATTFQKEMPEFKLDISKVVRSDAPLVYFKIYLKGNPAELLATSNRRDLISPAFPDDVRAVYYELLAEYELRRYLTAMEVPVRYGLVECEVVHPDSLEYDEVVKSTQEITDRIKAHGKEGTRQLLSEERGLTREYEVTSRVLFSHPVMAGIFECPSFDAPVEITPEIELGISVIEFDPDKTDRPTPKAFRMMMATNLLFRLVHSLDKVERSTGIYLTAGDIARIEVSEVTGSKDSNDNNKDCQDCPALPICDRPEAQAAKEKTDNKPILQ